MENDLISKKALLEQMDRMFLGADPADHEQNGIFKCRVLVKEAPSIAAEPVRHGRWETYPSHANRRCSVCKIEWDKPKFNIRANYCPNCGAKMDRGAEDG